LRKIGVHFVGIDPRTDQTKQLKPKKPPESKTSIEHNVIAQVQDPQITEKRQGGLGLVVLRVDPY